MEQVKTGIICDNYKVDRYKEVLEERGFDNYEVLEFMNGISQIHVMVDPSEVGIISQMCKALELGFARAKKNKRRNRRY